MQSKPPFGNSVLALNAIACACTTTCTSDTNCHTCKNSLIGPALLIFGSNVTEHGTADIVSYARLSKNNLSGTVYTCLVRYVASK